MVAALMGKLNGQYVSRNSTRNEDSFAIVKTQSGATQAELFYAEFFNLFQIMACKRAILSSMEGWVANRETRRWSLILARA